jgi:hypothetical protein
LLLLLLLLMLMLLVLLLLLLLLELLGEVHLNRVPAHPGVVHSWSHVVSRGGRRSHQGRG